MSYTFACGGYTSFAIDRDGAVWSCGYNGEGQLGLSRPGSKFAMQKVTALPERAIAVRSGSNHTVFLTESNNVWGCGCIGYKIACKVPTLLQLPPIVDIFISAKCSLFLDFDGGIWCCGDDNKNYPWYTKGQPYRLEHVPKMQQAAGGFVHAIFLDVDGKVWGCGSNESNQLNLKVRQYPIVTAIPNLPMIEMISAGLNNSHFLDTEGNVWVCGANEHGQLGLGHVSKSEKLTKIETLPPIKSVVGGGYHSLFLDVENSVWACGHNVHGATGLGETKEDIPTPKKIEGIPPIFAISAAFSHSLLCDFEGNVWSCGSHMNRELNVLLTENFFFPQQTQFPQVGTRVGSVKSARNISA